MRAPIVKPEHLPDRLDDGRIRIGGQAYGLAAEIQDPDGWIWTLLQAMNGERSPEEIARVVIEAHPDITRDDALSGLDQLISAGYIEDAQPPETTAFTSREQERYDRTRKYFRFLDLTPREDPWWAQTLLKESHIAVLGVGGTGGAVAMSLARIGIGRLHLVDCDTVELSNLNRQVLYDEDDIGKSKVKIAHEKLQRVNTNIAITSTEKRINDVDEILACTQEADAVAFCVDEPMQIRGWANEAFIATQTPWVEGGYNGPQIRMGMFTPGYGGCFACNQLVEASRLQQFSGETDINRYAERRRTSATTPMSAHMSGMLMAQALVTHVTGVPRMPKTYTLLFNFADMNNPYEVKTFPQWPTCPACGDK